jgi:hypothetical protein
VVRPQTEPDLMGWDSGSRAKLKSLQEQGVVGVRYKAVGCNVELEVLQCVGKGVEYAFSPYSANETKTAKSERDLFAELPIGAAKLGGKVGGGRALRTDYMLAGVLNIPVMKSFPPDKLEGQCDQATHVVSSLYLGGFAMVSGQTEKLEAEASFFGVGVGASQDRVADRVANEGNADACAAAQKEGKREPLCSVPLRLGLTPVEGRAAGSCPLGSDWDGKDCVQKQVVTKIECPAGTTLQGTSCVANVSKDCPAGTSFQAGKGCVANVVTGGPLPGVDSGSCPAGMSAIPKGSFKLSDKGDVTVGAFCLDLTEVTVEAYAACVKKGACSAENAGSQFFSGQDQGKGACNWGVAGREKHPMNCVDWGMAATFCRAQGGRLPTEEEWEWAARGGDAARTYPWGNAEPDFQACWSGVSRRSGTCAVGSAPEGHGRFGQLDLAGNVWEWTASLFSKDQTARVDRGGSWDNGGAAGLSAANRSRSEPSSRDDNLGFRCAR